MISWALVYAPHNAAGAGVKNLGTSLLNAGLTSLPGSK
jgi:hypothetical protein